MPKYGLATLIFATLTLASGACDRKAEVAEQPSRSATPPVASNMSVQPVRNSFPTATSVRLFVEAGKPGGGMQYSKPAGSLLSPEQRRKLDASLVITKMPQEIAACFIPHHFFRYYDAQGKQVGELNVCFCCNGVRAEGASNISPAEDQMLSADYKQVESLVRELGERTNVQCD